MNNEDTAPTTSPGEISQWPMLNIVYQTNHEAIAALLPPGIEPGSSPNVRITIYNLPVLDEPEYGILLTVDASYNGTEGEYAIGYGIDQEAPIILCQVMDGQPKFPCDTTYYRSGDRVTARCSHQGYTFFEFEGVSGYEEPFTDDEIQRHEWWIKVSRKVGLVQGYDFPPHVVHVNGKYGPGHRVKVDGKLTLRESPWDPIAELLPVVKEASAHLWWPEYRSRTVKLAGPLDPDAFWPHIDFIGGSRWPGQYGGPKPNA